MVKFPRLEVIMYKVRYNHYTMGDVWAEAKFDSESEFHEFINQLEFYGARYNIL